MQTKNSFENDEGLQNFSSNQNDNFLMEAKIENFEKIIWKIDSLVYNKVQFIDFISAIEFYQQILDLNKNNFQCFKKEQNGCYPLNLQDKKTSCADCIKKVLAKLNLVLSSYDFLLLSLQGYWKGGQYLYRPESKVKEKQIFTRFEAFLAALENLKKTFLPSLNFFTDCLIIKIQKFLAKLNLNPLQHYQFIQDKNHLTILTVKDDFCLEKHFKLLLTKYKLKISTQLTFEDLQFLVDFLDLSELFEKKQVQVEAIGDHNFQVVQIDLQEFITQKLQQVKNNQKVIVLCAGQNQTFKDLQRFVLDNLEPQNYLLIGENGGLTKIASKLSTRSFNGLLIVRNKEFDLLLELIDLSNSFEEIYVINKPYFNLNPWWQTFVDKKNYQKDLLEELHDLFLISYLNNLKTKNPEAKIIFVENYHPLKLKLES